ncbi:MAG: GNAT family protein [Bacteroidales bacterium]|nr:GNAT family protein [Bacteroidales bacterium]MDD3859352.1 GNAT family protein [Bacteroidales bacterium]
MEKIGKILENDNIILRKPEPEDLEFLFSLENNPDYWFISDTRTPFSKWQIKQHIENSVYDIFTNKELRLIIEQKSDKKQIGIIDLFEFDPVHSRAGVGILINKEFQNKTYALQTLSIIINYSFRILKLNQIWCNIDQENYVSIKLFTKMGFNNCGHLKEWKNKAKTFSDVLIFQLLNTF